MSALILNQSQAEAIYSAMCALNNVNGRIKVEFGNISQKGINVFETSKGLIRVVSALNFKILDSEEYEDQLAFASVYAIKL